MQSYLTTHKLWAAESRHTPKTQQKIVQDRAKSLRYVRSCFYKAFTGKYNVTKYCNCRLIPVAHAQDGKGSTNREQDRREGISTS